MPEFKELGEFLDPDLILPIRGKKYRITSPNAREGLRLRRLMLSDGGAQLNNNEELAEIMGLLGATLDDSGAWAGGVWDEMVDDGVSWPEIFHAGRTALIHYGLSEVMAEVNWRAGRQIADAGNPMPPEPTAPAPGARSSSPKKRAAAKKSTSRSRARTAPTTPEAGR